MSKATKAFFEQLKAGEPKISMMEAVKDGVQAVAPGLSLSKILSDVGSEMSQLFDHGRTELAAALFSGHAHVMYMKGQEQVEQPQLQGVTEKQHESPSHEM